MKKSLFAIALMATVAACGAQETEADQSGDTAAASEETAEVKLYEDLGGEATGPIYTKELGETLAVRGFDVVSYFVDDGVPVEGIEEFTVRYQGFDYRFANEENAKAFIDNPAKYAPAYGGYCAWAIAANDRLAEGDPNVYKIVDGKLYLNFNEQVAETWNEDIPGFIAKGDVNYPTHSPDEHYQQQ